MLTETTSGEIQNRPNRKHRKRPRMPDAERSEGLRERRRLQGRGRARIKPVVPAKRGARTTKPSKENLSVREPVVAMLADGSIGVTIAVFDAWLTTATAGDRIEYARVSHLYDLSPSHRGAYIGPHGFDLAVSGKALLFQKRIGPGLYSYLAVKVSADFPRVAFPEPSTSIRYANKPHCDA